MHYRNKLKMYIYVQQCIVTLMSNDNLFYVSEEDNINYRIELRLFVIGEWGSFSDFEYFNF